MSYKVGSSALKGVGGGSGSTTSSKRLNTKIINKTKGKAAAGASDPDLRLTEEPDVQLVPPSSPVPTEELVQDLAELRLPPADPEDDDLEDSEDCEEEEEGVSCSDDVEEEEEEDDDDENYEEEDDDEEEEQEDRTRPAIAAAAPLPRKPLPQHRPQLPISQRASKRQGRASGISIVGTSASKKARAGIRKNVSGTATCSNVSSGNCKSIVSSLRKNPRGRPYNPQPIFVPNSSSDDDEIEEDDEALEDEEEDEDGGDEYLEGDGSEDDDDEDPLEPPGFLLPADGDPNGIQGIPPDAQARLEAFFEAAGFTDGKLMSDPESLRKLTLTVSSALGEASAAINRMRDSQSRKSVEDGRNDSMEEGDSLLALACSSGYYELARVLLAMGAAVDDRGSKGDLTPLMDAASQGHVEIVKLLLGHGADINAQSACGNSALMYSCSAGHDAVVLELLRGGANVEDNNENGHTPLMEAASAGHVGVAKLLLEHGAGINTHSNEFKESALTVACYKGHLDMVRYLLEAGADQQHKTDEMHTALMEASMDGHVEVARLLLDSGAQVNMPADSFESPLTLAACGGHVELAELLLERGANIEEVNDEGYTPLMEAAREGHHCVVRALIKAGASINAQTDETHETALTLAACGGFLDVVDTLCKSGADIELGGSTPLMEASQEGHLQVVKYMLERGSDINRQTQSGDTALSFASENGHLEVCQLLVEMGSDPEHAADGGRTPLMKACRGGHTEVIKFLLEKKADVNRHTATNDHTPLSLACAGGHLASVEVLLAAGANPYHKLKDNSTMIIEAARGGHTPVIRCLLDHAPCTHGKAQPVGAKGQAAAKQGQVAKGAAVAQNQKTTDAKGNTAQVRAQQAAAASMLRKSRSTSTLDSTAPQQPQTKEAPTVADTKVKAKPQVQAVVETQVAKAPASAVAPLVDTVKVEPTEAGKTTLASQNLKCSTTEALTVTDGGKPSSVQSAAPKAVPATSTTTPALSTTPTAKKAGSSDGGTHIEACIECLKSGKILTESQLLAAGLVKRTGAEPAFAPTPLSPQSPSVTNDSITAGTVTTTSGTTFNAVPVGPPLAPLVPSQVTADTAISERPKAKANKPSARKQVQLQQQLQQLQQQVGQAPTTPSQSRGTSSCETSPGSSSDKSQITPTSSPLVSPIPLSSAAAQLTATPGVKVTLSTQPGPPGSITAALNQKGELVQYQMAGSGAQIPNFIGASTLTTAVQTTLTHAAAGALNNFQPQIILPHPPPLPQCIAAAAAAAGIITPSGAPPPGALKGHGIATGSGIAPKKEPHAPAQKPAPALANKATLTAQAPIAVNQVPPVASLAAPVGQKKQLAKRSRPFGQPTCTGSNPRQANQQTQTHTHTHSHSHATAVGTKQNQSASTQTTLTGQQAEKAVAAATKHFDVNCSTESNGESSLSIAAAAGHYEVVEFLLSRNARIEHRDKKGCTPLILAADGGHEKIVELLLNHNADIEAQSERTKDTALSLACTKGRFEVVELLVKRGANKEHRNVSDYTPLSLAASGGYVNIIKHLLSNGAEINSRTGSKLGISPLMLAAMNGNTAAVKLLLDSGSDINAQIETNKNTALTLACFQGRQEVVSLLLDRKANLEHRAKTGLTPLMEAANGGYTDVGKILIDRGADVNAPPVPATKDTALTIAADKGHFRFVELLLQKHAIVEVRNKKGCTPLWLACHGGHLDVAQILFKHRADLDVQDNRRVSCLMAAFRKGHVKVIRWIVKNVQQFPSDGEMLRYYASIQGEPELLKKCQQCGEFIKQAKDKQALEANKNASILLEELDMERSREESKRQAAARRREKKKKKKQEKKVVPSGEDDDDDEQDEDEEEVNVADSGIDANSLGSNSSGDRTQSDANRKNNKENLSSGKPEETQEPGPSTTTSSKSRKKKNRRDRDKQIQLNPVEPSIYEEKSQEKEHNIPATKEILREKENKIVEDDLLKSESKTQAKKEKKAKKDLVEEVKKVEEPQLPTAGKGTTAVAPAATPGPKKVAKTIPGESTKDLLPGPLMAIPIHPASHSRKNAASFDTHETVASTAAAPHSHTHMVAPTSSSSSAKTGTTLPSPASQLGKGGRKDDGWKEVTRSCPSSRSKKVIVPSSVISRVIGRGGCNINAIREATGAHIEVEKQQKGQSQPERTIQIKGTVESTKQAHTLITALMNEPDLDVKKLLPASGSSAPAATSFTGIFSATTVATTMTTVRASGTPVTSASGSSSAPMIDSNPFTTFVAVPTASGKANVGKSQKAPASPPVVHSVSPPVQKPSTPVNGNLAPFKGTTATTQINKKNTVFFTPSKNSVNNIQSSPSSVPSSTFTSTKLTQQPSNSSSVTSYSQYQNQPNRTTTPTKAVTPTFGSSPPTATPPPIPSSPTGQLNVGQSQHKGVGYMVPNSAMPSTAQGQTFTPSLAPMGPIINPSQQILNRAPGNQNGPQHYGSVTLQQSAPVSSNQAQTLNLSPGNNTANVLAPIGSARPGAATVSAESSEPTNIPPTQPLEYSPFSYTFSQTSWLPDEDSQNNAGSNYQQSGVSSNSSLNMNPLLSGSSVARAMNFASVAASGISSSTITTATAQITGGLHNGTGGGLAGNVGLGIGNTANNLSNKGIPEPLLESEMPKADASKAPGYRGTNMGSPVLRMNMHQQPQQQQHISSGFGLETFSQSSGVGGLSQGSNPNNMMGGFNNTQTGRHVSLNMNSQIGVGPTQNWGTALGPDMGPGIIPQQPSSNNPMGFPNNNRLNPRAPSFSLPQYSKMGPSGQQQPSVSAYQQQQQQQQQFSSIHQHQQPPQHNMPGGYKVNSFGPGPRNNNNITSGPRPGVGSGMNVTGGWNSYSNEAVDLSGLAVLAGATGTLDPAIFGQIESSMQDNQNIMSEDRRLPRPIGGERASKNNAGSGFGVGLNNMAPFSALDCLDSNQLPQPISIQQQQQPPHHGQGGNSWMGSGSMYGITNPPYQGNNQQTHSQHSNVNSIHGPHTQPRGNDTRNFLGRRFMEELDPASRMLELQQMFDGPRMMNGGPGTGLNNLGPGLLHLGGLAQQPIFPFGPGGDHLDQQHGPKLDQHNNSWDSHLHMDDKHNMGWGAKWSN